MRARWTRAACAALALHLAAGLPLVLADAMEETAATPSDMVEVETSAADMAAPQAVEDESIAEAPAAAPADATETTEAEPPPPTPPQEPPTELAEAPPPDQVQAQPPPPPPVQVEIPPPDALPQQEPDLLAEALPETVVSTPPPEPRPEPPRDEPPPVLAQVPVEEAVTAALPVPPQPPRPPEPPRPMRPRVTPAVATTPAPPTETPTAALAASPAPAPVVRRLPPDYLGALRAALERHKDYPLAARHRRAEGEATLHFVMRRDGTVTSWRITRSSGDSDLDEATGLMVRRASPLPPPPADYPGDTFELNIPVKWFILR